mgnify:CR=1 FL=1
MKAIKTTSENTDFQNLVKQLDLYLSDVDGDNHDFYHQFNGITMLKNCIVIYVNNEAVACGAIKKYDDKTVELKRMFTSPEMRGKGIASFLLKELEAWASALNFETIILETGKTQTDAVALYTKNQYQIIPNFGPYSEIVESVCFEKKI